MPNLVKFREDPDAMLVMALEDYDEVTGKAAKAAIMLQGRGRQDARPSPPCHRPRKGCWCRSTARGQSICPTSPGSTASPRSAVIAELGDLIYRDPETQGLADRRRLPLGQRAGRSWPSAEAAGPAYARNAEALRAVQPEDVLPGDIDANLGAPWIPAADIQAFAADCSASRRRPSTIGHLKKDAVWSVEAGHTAERVGRRHRRVRHAPGQRHLAAGAGPQSQDARHLRHDPSTATARSGWSTRRRRWPPAKSRSRSRSGSKAWIFADPERTERLVRIYNDTYNNLRPRLFDGSHLRFPRHEQDHHARTRTRRTRSGAA